MVICVVLAYIYCIFIKVTAAHCITRVSQHQLSFLFLYLSALLLIVSFENRSAPFSRLEVVRGHQTWGFCFSLFYVIIFCVSDAWLFVLRWPIFIINFFGYFSWFWLFSVHAKRLAGKSISKMTYFVTSGV